MKYAGRLQRVEDKLLRAQIAAIELLPDGDLWLFCEGAGRILGGGQVTPEETAMVERWQSIMAELLHLPPWQHAARSRIEQRLRQHYAAQKRQPSEPKRTPAEAYAPPATPAATSAPEPEAQTQTEPTTPRWNFAEARRQMRWEARREERRERERNRR